MYKYKRTIVSGKMVEYEYYNSIRKVGKNYGGKRPNISTTPEKMKINNRMRAVKNTQRLIACNYDEGDWVSRFSAPFGTFENENDFRDEVSRFFKRIKYRAKKKMLEFKYIGYIECGKLGKNWHLHIILEDAVRAIAQECWNYKNGMNFTPLYKEGNFEKLAEYIRKETSGYKRQMTSRNLKRPIVTVKEATKKEIRLLERGEMIKIPDGYYLCKDDSEYNYNDVTGASWYFMFMPVLPGVKKRIKKAS